MNPTPNFALLSASPNVRFEDLGPVAAAIMRQINDHFFRFWGERGTVTPFASQEQVPLTYWRITIVQGRPDGLLGVHRSLNNQPYAYVSDEAHWSVAVSHEVLEMLVDPTLSAFKAGSIGNPPRRVNFLIEVCDPCQAVVYSVDGVSVSDFVTPAYFDPGPAAGAQYSFRGAIERPHGVAPNGYLVWHDPEADQYFAYTSDGVNGQTVPLGNYPQGAGSSPREWVDGQLRKDGIALTPENLALLRSAAEMNQIATRAQAKPWVDQLRALKTVHGDAPATSRKRKKSGH